jgi:hypothetical protein
MNGVPQCPAPRTGSSISFGARRRSQQSLVTLYQRHQELGVGQGATDGAITIATEKICLPPSYQADTEYGRAVARQKCG